MNMGEKYIKDIVYGSIDGIITTFAVVSGVLGASLSMGVIIILGLANLFADGLSMAAGNFLSTKSEKEKIDKIRKKHRENIKKNPEGEAEELKKDLKKRGLSSESVEVIAKEITKNSKAWENVLVGAEYGEYMETNPHKTAFATFAAFVTAGFIPLLAFILNYFTGVFSGSVYTVAIILTALALFGVGTMKASIIEKGPIRSGLETLLIGGVAAVVAFSVGYFLKGFV